MGKSIILACKNLRLHLDKAQEAMGTSIPVVELDTSLHSDPAKMREKILEEISHIPAAYDTVLVAMGFCGGSWKNVSVDRRIVIPKIDDCISMLLTTDDVPKANLKICGCMYITDDLDSGLSIPGIRDSLVAKYGEKKGGIVFDMMFASYNKVSIIDTGAYDSHTPRMLEFAARSAELIDASFDHVPGSNIILQKLVSGRWDAQFVVLEPWQTAAEEDFC